ncbi:hypothetical protein I858_011090 [Planococcus versutus]|uniref:Uncharacterized protein n=1 Tax=Planococcus versutus TaxID=1302659 RepID=A0A1B1S2X4_9BACL|nr:hypothetical protein I858_011090 [Planococcus versutus]
MQLARQDVAVLAAKGLQGERLKKEVVSSEIAAGGRFRARRMRVMQLARQDVAVLAAKGLQGERLKKEIVSSEIAAGRRFRAHRMRVMQLARQDVAVLAAKGLQGERLKKDCKFRNRCRWTLSCGRSAEPPRRKLLRGLITPLFRGKDVERMKFVQCLCDEASVAIQEHILALRHLSLFLKVLVLVVGEWATTFII